MSNPKTTPPNADQNDPHPWNFDAIGERPQRWPRPLVIAMFLGLAVAVIAFWAAVVWLFR